MNPTVLKSLWSSILRKNCFLLSIAFAIEANQEIQYKTFIETRLINNDDSYN